MIQQWVSIFSQQNQVELRATLNSYKFSCIEKHVTIVANKTRDDFEKKAESVE